MTGFEGVGFRAVKLGREIAPVSLKQTTRPQRQACGWYLLLEC